MAGLPVAILSFWLFLTSFRDNVIAPDASLADAKEKLAELKNRAKDARRADRKKRSRRVAALDRMDEEIGRLLPKIRDKEAKPSGTANSFVKKWMDFGGGFYGVMALFTFIVLELGQIIDFLANFTSIADFIARIGLNMLIQQLLEALMNFVWSLIWPVAWLDRVGGVESGAVWLAISYIGYRAGHHYARIGIERRQEVWKRAARRVYRRAERAVQEQREKYSKDS